MTYTLAALAALAAYWAIGAALRAARRKAAARDAEFVARHVVDAMEARAELVRRHAENGNAVRGNGKGRLTGFYNGEIA